jgi:hypothetical protein
VQQLELGLLSLRFVPGQVQYMEVGWLTRSIMLPLRMAAFAFDTQGEAR